MAPVFVFGSNLAGRHGAGAAKWAVQNRGAVYGRGYGSQGNSFAIPTKDGNLRTLAIDMIEAHVAAFLSFARQAPDMRFYVTPIGCGLAGYTPEQIAPLFHGAPSNVALPDEFAEILNGEDFKPQQVGEFDRDAA